MPTTQDLINKSADLINRAKTEGVTDSAGTPLDPVAYLRSLAGPNTLSGITNPDEKELQGVREEMLATSQASRAQTNVNSNKLDQKITTLQTASTGLTPARDTASNGGASYGWKKVMDPKTGIMKEIPQDADPASYGYQEITGTEGGAGTGTATKTPKSTPLTPYEQQMQDYLTNLDKSAADRTTKDQEWQARLDETQRALIQSIEKKYEARRLKMEDINRRYLEGKRIAGISAGRSRYTTTMEEGLLSTEEMDGQARLAEIDAEELSLIAQAKQARDEKSYKAFNDSMDRADALAKEKMDVITKLHQATIDADKILEEKRKTAIAEEQATLNLQQDKATSYARGAYDMMKDMSEEEKDAYIKTLAETQKIDPEILRGAIQDYADKEETQNSQIAARESAATAREQSLSIAEQRLALQKEKADNGGGSGGGNGGGDSGMKLTPTQRSKILALGNYTAKEVSLMEKDIMDYGLNAVLERLDPADQPKIKSILEGEKATETKQNKVFLDENYIKQNYDDATLKEMADKAGYRHVLSSWSTEKQNFIENLVKNVIPKYRENGYTDKEIIKLIEGK